VLIAATLPAGTTVVNDATLSPKEVYNRYVRLFDRLIQEPKKIEPADEI
jgi:hypothetical protein